MHHPRLLRKAVPLTLLALSACGVASQDATSSPVAGAAVARLADGATSCPSGGNVLKYGVDKNGNGKLDDSELTGSFDICNGVTGTLTKVASVTAGAQCESSGVVVTSGPDTNHNGALDDSEVVTTTPICASNGAITSVVGAVYLYNSLDVARYANVETISGELYIDISGETGSVALPKLRSVGAELNVNNESGGCDLSNDAMVTSCFALRRSAHQEKRRATRAARSKQTMVLNNSYAPITVTLSLPVLTSVGGRFDLDDGVGFSAPVLATIEGEVDCEDPNAIFPALTISGDLDCGDFNTNFAHLTVYGGDYYPQGTNYANSQLTSVGVMPQLDGSVSWTEGELGFNDSSSVTASLPNMTQVGYLTLEGVVDPNATLSIPSLTAVGALYLKADYSDGGDFLSLNPNTHPYKNLDLPLFRTVKGRAIEATSSNPGYASLIGQLEHIGGAFYARSHGALAINANHLLTVGGFEVYNSDQVTSVSAPQLTALVPSDPNYAFCNWYLGDRINCNSDSDSLKRFASVLIGSNAALTSLNLGNVNSIPGGLFIFSNPQLATITGLTHLTVLGLPSDVGFGLGSLIINDTLLTDLSAFASITSAGGGVQILNNANLASISDLHITGGSADTCPIIRNSPLLDYCAVKHYAASYNAGCVLDDNNIADYNLKNPCAGTTTCTQSQSCTVDCTTNAGYTCN